MKLLLSLSAALLVITDITAQQTQVEVSSFSFSDGVHPTFSFLFEGTDTKYVESFWKDELKNISASVSNKKEVIGAGAVVPQISADTVRVLMKAEQRKGSPLLTAHVAILATGGFIGPSSDARVFDAAKAFVQQRNTQLRRQLAEQELTLGEKGLAKLNAELQVLQRDKERAEAGIEKSKQRAAEAVIEQERAKAEADELGPRISALQSELATTPSDEGTKELNGLIKDRNRAQDRNRKAQDEERNMTKKADDLAWAIKQNVEDQAKKSEAIAEQTTLVKTLREKLADIR
ncbi:MAG TPA: hypothetical protein PLB89_12450 [Flavobacteriales bacterium]|nr:hypothetical protein [Flavobacteriales bacterium]